MSRSYRTRLERSDLPAAARYLIRHRGGTPAIVIGLLSCLALLPARAAPPTLPPPAERRPESTARTLEILAREGTPAEERKVWIYFTDKGVSDQDAFRIRLLELAATLDPHAASRRARSLGPWLTDFHDLLFG